MRPVVLISLALLLLTSACVRPLSIAPTNSGSNPFTPAPEARLCAAADLQTSSSAHTDASSAILGATLINRSNRPCRLQNPAQAVLLGADGPLDIDLVPVEETPETPELSIAPGESVVLALIWENYCGPTFSDGLTIRLTLPGGKKLDVKVKAASAPRCRDAQAASTLTVNPYSYPP